MIRWLSWLVIVAVVAALPIESVKAKDVVWVTCPLVFPEKGPGGETYKFLYMEVWENAYANQISNNVSYLPAYDIDTKSRWDLRCWYHVNPRSVFRMPNNNARQLTIPIPKGVIACDYVRDKKKRQIGVCTGPSPAGPIPEQQVYVAQRVDYAATLHGFGLLKTPEEIIATAHAKGMEVISNDLSRDEKTRFIEIGKTTDISFAIFFSPQTGLSREIEYRYPKDTILGDSIVEATLAFGSFSDFTTKGCEVWDQATGVVVTECSPDMEKNTPSSIRLIDRAQEKRDEDAAKINDKTK